MKSNTFIARCFILCACISSFSSYAAKFEIQPFFGQMWSSDLRGNDGSTDISLDSGGNFGIALAWQDSPNGQGQIMLNSVSHDYTSDLDQQKYSLDILYAHFNGVAMFRQENYITTVSLGLGGAYFDADGGEQLYPSASIAVGTRYEFSETMAFFTELRGYASIVDDEDDIFCKAETCNAMFDDALWMDTSISIGLAIKF